MYLRVEEQDGAGKRELEERAKAFLDRVLVMRVFDFVGVVEAVGEIGASLEVEGAGTAATEEPGGDLNRDGVEQPGRGQRNGLETDEKQPEGKVGMIVIDSMTNVVSSMMSHDHVQGKYPQSHSLNHPMSSRPTPHTGTLTNIHHPPGHALLTTFLRTLHHLTRTHHLSTLLLNSAVATQAPPLSGRQPHNNSDNHVSIFAATLGKPALGKTYAYLLDTSLFLSGGQKGDEGLVAREEGMVVLEVLYDRFGGREGRWVALRASVSDVD